jgi:hypothetical protein
MNSAVERHHGDDWVYKIRRHQVNAPPDAKYGEYFGEICAGYDADHFRIVAQRSIARDALAMSSAQNDHQVFWFTDRDTARAVGTALLACAANERLLADQQWTGADGTVVRVEPTAPLLHIGDCSWPLAIDDAVDLGQRLIAWAGMTV